jgi:hypothetical protein
MSVVSNLLITFSPFFVSATLAFGVLKYADSKQAPIKHWAMDQRKEADKVFPTKNKHLDFALCLAHGT